LLFVLSLLVVTFEVYRWQGKDKPYVQLFDVDTKECGPMVLDALLYMYVAELVSSMRSVGGCLLEHAHKSSDTW
jgi:hypothetical protein